MSYICGSFAKRHPNVGKQHKVTTGKRTVDEGKTVLVVKKSHSAKGNPDTGRELRQSHNRDEVLTIAQQIFLIRNGSIFLNGTTDEIRDYIQRSGT